MAYIQSGDKILTSSPSWRPEEVTVEFMMDDPDGKEPQVFLFGGAQLTEPEH